MCMTRVGAFVRVRRGTRVMIRRVSPGELFRVVSSAGVGPGGGIQGGLRGVSILAGSGGRPRVWGLNVCVGTPPLPEPETLTSSRPPSGLPLPGSLSCRPPTAPNVPSSTPISRGAGAREGRGRGAVGGRRDRGRRLRTCLYFAPGACGFFGFGRLVAARGGSEAEGNRRRR